MAKYIIVLPERGLVLVYQNYAHGGRVCQVARSGSAPTERLLKLILQAKS